MKRLSVFCALLLMPAVLAACSGPLPVTVFNNTGLAIEVRSADDKGSIAPGRFKQFDYPQREQVLRLSDGGCEYLYDFSVKLGDYSIDRTLLRGVQVQVEKDFSIDLLSASYAGDTPAFGDAILKRAGFPLRPISRKCASAPKP